MSFDSTVRCTAPVPDCVNVMPVRGPANPVAVTVPLLGRAGLLPGEAERGYQSILSRNKSQLQKKKAKLKRKKKKNQRKNFHLKKSKREERKTQKKGQNKRPKKPHKSNIPKKRKLGRR